MSEYIEREAAYPLAKKICDAIDSEDFQRLNFGMRILDWIDDLPAVDVRPVVRGKWKYRGQKVIDDLFPTYACSVCHGVIPADWRRKCNFCPNCGADMRPTSMSGAKEES